MESRSRLKQRLARLFRPSSLLRYSSCNSATSGSVFTSTATNSSSRSLSTTTNSANAADVVIGHEPVFIPHNSLFLRNNNRLDRSFSFSSSTRMMSTLDCGGCRPNKTLEAADVVSVGPRCNESTMKKERRVRETGEFYETGKREGRACPPASPASPSKDHPRCGYYYDFDKIDVVEGDHEAEGGELNNNNNNKKKKKKKKKRLVLSNAYGFSSSSDDGSEFFSSGEVMGKEDETEAFFSSRSFSSDSSEFYKRPSSRKKKNHIRGMKQITSSRIPPSSRRGKRTSHDVLRPLVSADLMEEDMEHDGGGGFPVLKRSSHPYVDFRDSMAEMIVERQLFGAKALEKLLHSYLSLNSPRHHSVILRAFADISEALFGH